MWHFSFYLECLKNEILQLICLFTKMLHKSLGEKTSKYFFSVFLNLCEYSKHHN